VDHAPTTFQVTPLERSELTTTQVETIEEAIELYLERFQQKFTPHNYKQRERHLRRFTEYLKDTGHSMRLQDLTYADGKGFMDTLTNARTGERLSLTIRKDYKSALRTLSRFLVQSSILKVNVFFELRVE
jgi:hypothetical protein